jgi:hypothetical protein
MTNTNIIKNKDFYVCPEGFYYIGAQEYNICAHTTFTQECGEKNVNGQYRLQRKCNDCMAYRTYYLYAKVAKKGRK